MCGCTQPQAPGAVGGCGWQVDVHKGGCLLPFIRWAERYGRRVCGEGSRVIVLGQMGCPEYGVPPPLPITRVGVGGCTPLVSGCGCLGPSHPLQPVVGTCSRACVRGWAATLRLHWLVCATHPRGQGSCGYLVLDLSSLLALASLPVCLYHLSLKRLVWSRLHVFFPWGRFWLCLKDGHIELGQLVDSFISCYSLFSVFVKFFLPVGV